MLINNQVQLPTPARPETGLQNSGSAPLPTLTPSGDQYEGFVAEPWHQTPFGWPKHENPVEKIVETLSQLLQGIGELLSGGIFSHKPDWIESISGLLHNTPKQTETTTPLQSGNTSSMIFAPLSKEAFHDLVGIPAVDAEQFAMERGASTVRVISSGTPITLDYNPTRINIHTDANGITMKISVG